MGSDPQLTDILCDWYERRVRGEDVDPAEVIAEHPEYADELRERFAAAEFVEVALDGAARAWDAPPQAVARTRLVRR